MRTLLCLLALGAALVALGAERAAGCQVEHWWLEHYARVSVTCAGQSHGLIVVWR